MNRRDKLATPLHLTILNEIKANVIYPTLQKRALKERLNPKIERTLADPRGRVEVLFLVINTAVGASRGELHFIRAAAGIRHEFRILGRIQVNIVTIKMAKFALAVLVTRDAYFAGVRRRVQIIAGRETGRNQGRCWGGGGEKQRNDGKRGVDGFHMPGGSHGIPRPARGQRRTSCRLLRVHSAHARRPVVLTGFDLWLFGA